MGLIEVQGTDPQPCWDGTQDNLSGCEKAVQVKVKALPDAQVRSSAFLWAKLETANPGANTTSARAKGCTTHMKALRPD
ncbi:hypothetical protein [Citrobacter enshiensis]|uniref:hypothetical protein n=1 Tax=Citrobacter enshiensis TaxID=2971264 RepID=UPI00399D5DEF